MISFLLSSISIIMLISAVISRRKSNECKYCEGKGYILEIEEGTEYYEECLKCGNFI